MNGTPSKGIFYAPAVLFVIVSVSPEASSARPQGGVKRLVEQHARPGKEARYPEAAAIAGKVLAIQERSPGPEHTDTAGAYGKLSLIYQTTGNYVKAGLLCASTIPIPQKPLTTQNRASCGETADIVLPLFQVRELKTLIAPGAYLDIWRDYFTVTNSWHFHMIINYQDRMRNYQIMLD